MKSTLECEEAFEPGLEHLTPAIQADNSGVTEESLGPLTIDALK